MDVLEGAAEFLGRVEIVALEPLAIGIDHTLGGVDHAFAAGVVAGPGDERADRFHRFFAAGPFHGFKIKVGTDQGSVAYGVHDERGSFRG
jgi:hypothetical protein